MPLATRSMGWGSYDQRRPQPADAFVADWPERVSIDGTGLLSGPRWKHGVEPPNPWWRCRKQDLYSNLYSKSADLPMSRRVHGAIHQVKSAETRHSWTVVHARRRRISVLLIRWFRVRVPAPSPAVSGGMMPGSVKRPSRRNSIISRSSSESTAKVFPTPSRMTADLTMRSLLVDESPTSTKLACRTAGQASGPSRLC